MEKLDNLLQGSVTHPQGLLALDNEAITFLKSQCDTEMVLDQYSPSFGAKLLPGMVTQPMFTMPKKGSAKLCLVNNHSAGLNSLNSLIPTEGGFIILNNLSDLGANIHAIMCERPGLRPKLVWKSDALQAYRCLLMHPHWQVCQVTLIDGNYHIDHCAIFGNRTLVTYGASSLGLCVGLQSMNVESMVFFTTSMTPSMYHSVTNYLSMHLTGIPCPQIRLDSSSSLMKSECHMKIRSSCMVNLLR